MKLFIASGIFHPEPGGPATYLHELLPELLQRDWEIRALSFGDAAGGSYPYPVTRIPRKSLPIRTFNYARAARPLLQWADVTYLHTLGLPLYGDHHAPRIVKIVGDLAWERAVRKGWIPPTENIDDFQIKRYGRLAEIGKANRAREAQSLDGVIVPSEYLKRMVMGWGVDERRIRVIYNALPPAATLPSMTQAEARAALTLDDAPTILTVGRLLPWKGVDHLIAALVNVKQVRLLVAGDGDILPALQAQAVAAGVAERVMFLGRVSREQMPIYMRAADYVALYSGYEGLSHTLLESLRVGTPVIASQKGGNPEVVRHGVNGLLVPYVDMPLLTEALRDAFYPGTRESLAAHSSVGMERFTFAHMVEQTDEALRTFAGR
ncbi:MAG: glycosyltransferase family 4 protein [Chloroflexi bacterium]|uniref:glycosyltransferase family 4 protein n=1 Tax=Candidatus Flexifilum breve TaxID=3140694 RepID=UPI003134BF80|nr:glycosyltransferase family 4 protein [Chloroflexota bacterium]